MSELAQEPEIVGRSVVFHMDVDRHITKLAGQEGISTNLLVVRVMKDFMESQGYSFDPGILDHPELNRDISRNRAGDFGGVIITSAHLSE